MSLLLDKHNIIKATFTTTWKSTYVPAILDLALYPGVQKGGGNAWYTLFVHALNLLLGNCNMNASDVDVWAGFC